MFLLILVMTSICGLGEATLFQTHPVDTLAILGGNVSLSCTPVSAFCGGHLMIAYWQRRGGPSVTPTWDRSVFSGTEISRRFEGRKRYTVSVSDCTWTLRLEEIQPVDEIYYICFINDGYSKVAILTIVDPIDTTVLPSRIDRYAGENAYFNCHTRPLDQHGLEYTRRLWMGRIVGE